MNNLLELENVHTYIGQYHILQGISMDVPEGEVTVILGRNGAGKTTTLETILGIKPPSKGTIRFKDEEIQGFPLHNIVRRGIGYVPEDKRLFGTLTVEENLRLAERGDENFIRERRKLICDIFPDLKAAWKRPASTLSGGQQQMLCIARGLINDNSIMLIDEPSMGLAPKLVQEVMSAVDKMKGLTTVLMVEQNLKMAETVGDRCYILDKGMILHSGDIKELVKDKELQRNYLGVTT